MFSTLNNIEEAGHAISKTEERRLEASFGQLRTALISNGISSLAVFADILPKDDADPEGEHVIVTATCAITTVSKDTLETSLPLKPELLAAIFSKERSPKEVLKSRAKTTPVEPPEVIEIPVGKTLVLKNLLEYSQSMVEVVKVYTQTYLIPQDESYDTLTLIQFATPTLDLSKDFSELFGKIAETFAFLREGDETVPTGKPADFAE